MNTSALYPSQAWQTPGRDRFESMPEDASLRLLSLLGIKTLAQCCFVSTKWNALAQNDKLWQPIVKILRLKCKIGLKKACCDTINVLRLATKKAETCLILAAHKIDNQSLDQGLKPQRRMQERKIELVHVTNDLYKILINKGFTAHRKLCALGLSSREKIEMIALHLLNIYNDAIAWATLASDKIKENDTDGADNIVNTYLKDKYGLQVKVRKSILEYMCQKQQFFKAIDYYKQHCLDIRYTQNHHDSLSIIFNSCMDAKQYVAAEKYIDEIETNNSKKFQIQQLIDAFLTDKQIDQAKRLIKKYYDLIKTAPKNLEAITWLQIFVMAGEVSKAWVMAHEWKSKNDIIIPRFKQMLLDNGFTEEAEKL